MFHFFSKKYFLIDQLEGFVDIHNHILPGIDDGAKTPSDSIKILNKFKEFGVTDFIATPHIMSDYYPNTPQTIRESLVLLENELLVNNIKDFKIKAGAEHMIDGNFETILSKNEVMPLYENYILIEMSFLQPPINFNELVKKLIQENYYPILAHPERYAFIHNRIGYHKECKSLGVLYQLNLLSLSDYYGKEVQKSTIKLLENNLYNFVGTDIHNMNQMERLKELRIQKKMVDRLLPLIENTNYNFG